MEKPPDVKLGICFSTWNVGSMPGKQDEIFETLKRCFVDICFLQEVRWKRQGGKITGNGFKLFWNEVCRTEKGVGVSCQLVNWKGYGSWEV